MTMKCTQEEYEALIAPTVYTKRCPAPNVKTNKDRAEEIALGTAQQKLDKANELHDIDVDIARKKARDLELRIQAKELDLERKRLVNEALLLKQAVLNAQQPKALTAHDVVRVVSVLGGLFVFIWLVI